MTAYEMRISDWSSDVCSSDLAGEVHGQKSDLHPNEHQPENPHAQPLRKGAAAHHMYPVVKGVEQRKNHSSDQHIMQVGNDEIGIMRLPVERHHRHHNASEPTHDEGHKPAYDEQRRCVEARFSHCQSGDPGKYLDTGRNTRSEEQTSELQSLMRRSYAVFC